MIVGRITMVVVVGSSIEEAAGIILAPILGEEVVDSSGLGATGIVGVAETQAVTEEDTTAASR